MNPHRQVRLLRQKQGITQQQIADHLCMSRPAFNKLENGKTGMAVEMLQRIARFLHVPVSQLLQAMPEPASTAWTDIDLMLETTYYYLSETKFKFVAYDELTPAHLALLATKGFASREAYEDTPLGGRLYAYGPHQVTELMFYTFGMSTLFEQDLVHSQEWKQRYQLFKQARAAGLTEPEPEVDEQEYFVVFHIGLEMPDGTEASVQLAQRDIPDGMDEHEALERLILKAGALDGYIGAFSLTGYDPFSEIVTSL
ncbi:helix-turn-helix domain-containing protein [Hymenobacter guriensis]|uniref:Helix-turn-helix transcriptional regulator n=1 Tax=Hymenobacter guriensis TaxID=2793065 RepID=A0ABS0L8B4_9BACT|nr:helix-turn-helix transcriptional regulator [Hymenobacter guriensis]MBG8556311.1 helix-turn-helix transcriptional regulator [Hymenobacter guriensis]